MKHLIVIMGVSGAGKSTLAKALSEHLGYPFLEGDDYHPTSNIDKMSAGLPLANNDRVEWIGAMAQAVRDANADRVILACSALNAFVRERLAVQTPFKINWIYLRVSRTELLRRLSLRENHFMKASMLESQISAMTPPKEALMIDGNQPFETCLSEGLRTVNSLF